MSKNKKKKKSKAKKAKVSVQAVLNPQPDKAVVLLEIEGEIPTIGNWQSFKNWVKRNW